MPSVLLKTLWRREQVLDTLQLMKEIVTQEQYWRSGIEIQGEEIMNAAYCERMNLKLVYVKEQPIREA